MAAEHRAVPPAWVYLLRCADGSLYTGWTTDLERRLRMHARGRGSHYVACRLPFSLALAIPMPDASAARREEARIKRLPRPQKLALLTASDGYSAASRSTRAPDTRVPGSAPSETPSRSSS